MPNFFFNPGEYPEVSQQGQAANDDFLFNQGGAKGLGQIQFHDYHLAFEGVDLPNVREFFDQTETYRELLATEPPGPDQMKDVDFLMAGGEIFALVVYAQLILENARIYEIDDDLLDQIFDFMVRDMSKYALQLYSKPSSTPKQMELCQRIIRKAVTVPERFERVWEKHITALDGAYEMNL
jgi:acyl-CoA dehydrogenase